MLNPAPASQFQQPRPRPNSQPRSVYSQLPHAKVNTKNIHTQEAEVKMLILQLETKTKNIILSSLISYL